MDRHPPRSLVTLVIVAAAALSCHHAGMQGQTTPAPQPAVPRPTPTVSQASLTPTPPPPPPQSLEQLLAGRISGVDVTRTTGGGISVRIHGVATFYGSTEPLYLVDGVPVEAGPYGALEWLNPDDIESITVLKGAAAAIYGVRGGNGVISIRTKGAK